MVQVKYAVDLLLWTLAAPIALVLRVEGGVTGWSSGLAVYAVIGLALKAAALSGFGLHLRAWRWVGVHDLFRLIVATGVVSVALGVIVVSTRSFFDGAPMVPLSVPIIEAAVALLVLSAARMSRRLRHERAQKREVPHARLALIVGAGEAGVLLARELLRYPEAGITPVGFLEDDPIKARANPAGLPVIGGFGDLAEAVREHRVEEVLLAIPSAPGGVVRRLVEAARRAGVPSRTVPQLADLAAGLIEISEIREVAIEDLLGREPVRLDPEPIRDYIAGRRVLVTGAGGSIGSEIVRQVARFGASSIVLLGRGENSIYQIDRELAHDHPGMERHPVICDVRDRASLASVLARLRPEVVFHAAAHKHVPLMEANPSQAVLNNVIGTRNLAELAGEFGVDRLVNVSTDKAVNPTNVMGASKRAAEMVVSQVGVESACTMVSVRFGNVLGSRGSVVPLFKEQIARGGPVTVTHPDMVRYFMTIPEAAQLVLQAGAFAESGRVYVLDMGEPVRIADLARDLILLSGLEPGVDIEVTFSGVRPGEKLFEELLMAEEGTLPGPHEKIFVARGASPSPALERSLSALVDAALAGGADRVRRAFQAVVPTYRPEAAATGGDGIRAEPSPEVTVVGVGPGPGRGRRP